MAGKERLSRGQLRALRTIADDFDGVIEPVDGTSVYQLLADKMGVSYTQIGQYGNVLIKAGLLSTARERKRITRLEITELGRQYLAQASQQEAKAEAKTVVVPHARSGCKAAKFGLSRPLRGSVEDMRSKHFLS
jgi:DNA-binding MarR family transcriptional regulator